ncbi:DUF1330 domain-containing protein [Phenylobacterium sp.]|uniref:DUF1330 domain-containing protein n=1 Tax=Phenylobacterium sp. TaxID=1871053 RepID=UPI00286B1C7E|nr:DUF1330 domain-containing protein [Phenylobacterium sp.]
MSVYIDPDRDAWAIFKALPRDQPIQMLNLVRVKPMADYPEDHPDHGKAITGLDAYRAYGRTTAPILKRLGGRQVWAGKPQVLVTGPRDEAWDLAFIAEYPNAGAFLAMVSDPDYQEFVKHRTAGVADSRLLRLDPVEPGEGFGE